MLGVQKMIQALANLALSLEPKSKIAIYRRGVRKDAYRQQLAIFEEKKKLGWKAFLLADDIGSREEFIAFACKSLPLDPPLEVTSHKWDALSDSLGGGIHELEAFGVVFFWPGSEKLRVNEPDAYQEIVSIFEFNASILCQKKYGAGRATDFLVLLS